MYMSRFVRSFTFNVIMVNEWRNNANEISKYFVQHILAGRVRKCCDTSASLRTRIKISSLASFFVYLRRRFCSTDLPLGIKSSLGSKIQGFTRAKGDVGAAWRAASRAIRRNDWLTNRSANNDRASAKWLAGGLDIVEISCEGRRAGHIAAVDSSRRPWQVHQYAWELAFRGPGSGCCCTP